MQKFADDNNKAIMCGDFNLNTINNTKTEYQALLSSYGFQNHIVNRTRVMATTSFIIDHIHFNYDAHSTKAGEIVEDISDHYATSFDNGW